MLERGIAAVSLGRLSEAVAAYDQGLEILSLNNKGQARAGDDQQIWPRRRLGARILLSQAFAVHELGDRVRSARALDDVATIADAGGYSEIVVLVHAQRGAMLIREGQLTDALGELDRAVDSLDHAPPVDRAKVLLNRGELHGLLGQVNRAKDDCARARRLALECGPPELVFYATHNLGWYEFLSGNLPRALELMPSGEETLPDYERGIVGMDRAKALLGAGLVSEADRSLVEVCDALERTELVQFLAEAELIRAEVALLAGQPQLAGELSRRAIGRLKPRHNRRASLLGELMLLRADVAGGVRRDQVVRRADRLAKAFTELGMHDQERMSRLIAISHLTKSGSTRRSLPHIRRGQPLDLRLYDRLVRARLAFGRGDRASGRRYAIDGMAELTQHQAQFGSLDLQTSSAAHGVQLAAMAITEEIEHGTPAAVLSWVERARAISGRIPEVHPPNDAQTAELLGELRWAANQLEVERAKGHDTDDLRRRRNQLQRTIRARSWTVRGSIAVPKIPSIQAIRGPLGPATLVAVFVLHDQLHAIVLTSNRCTLTKIATVEAIEQLARRVNADFDVLAMDLVPAPLRTAALNSLIKGLRALDELLLVPLELPRRPVVLLPPGRFAGLPWGELPTFAGRPLTIAPSAASWLRAQTTAGPSTGPVVAIAGPGLSRAEDEAAAVAAAWPDCQTLTGADATGEAVLAAIDGARLVHVAAHGRHQRDSPLFSSISLFDGPMVGYDLDRVTRPPTQAVLSACDLGRATVRAGDEALGLSRALLHSGTSTVISGVAKVSDRGAANLMSDYHRRLAAGSAPAYALAEALTEAAEPLPFLCFGAGW